jgi:hypothetical protein
MAKGFIPEEKKCDHLRVGKEPCVICDGDRKTNTKDPLKMSKAFSIGWAVIKFNPDDDTCEGCGGQKTPEHPFYAPDGPENGNCNGETPECRGD